MISEYLQNLKIPCSGKFILIGGTALGTRRTKDIDFICHSSDLVGDGWEIDKTGYSAYKKPYDVLLTDNSKALSNLLFLYGSTEIKIHGSILFALKDSHIHLPRRNWFNDIFDYHQLKDKEQSFLKTWTDRYRDELNKVYKSKNMNLNVSKESFFDDAVKKYVDHDTIHEYMAFGDIPVYKLMQKVEDEVKCSKDLWDQLSYEQRLNCVLEETYVIACERFVIPRHITSPELPLIPNGNILGESLKKVCTTLSSGWFRKFSIDNYYVLSSKFDIKLFKQNCERLINQEF